eukprot:TCONS_00050612-protein
MGSQDRAIDLIQQDNDRQQHQQQYSEDDKKTNKNNQRRDYDHREFAFQHHPRLKKKRLSNLIHPDTLDEDYQWERRGTMDYNSGLLGAGNRNRRTSHVKTTNLNQAKNHKPMKRRKRGSLADEDIRRPIRDLDQDDVDRLGGGLGGLLDSNKNDEEAIQNIMVHLEEKQKQRKQEKYGEDLAGIKERMAELLKDYPEEEDDIFDIAKLADPDFFISKETKEKNLTQIEINRILEQYLEVCCDRTDLLSNVEDALHFEEFQRSLKSPELENLDNVSSEISMTIEMIHQSSSKLNRLYSRLTKLYGSKATIYTGVDPRKNKVDMQKHVINKFKTLQSQSIKRKEKSDTWKYAATEIVDLLKNVREEGAGDQEKLEMEIQRLLHAFTTQSKQLEEYQEMLGKHKATISKVEAVKDKLKNDNLSLQDDCDRTRVQAKTIQMKCTKLETELQFAEERLTELQRAESKAAEEESGNYLRHMPSYYVQNQNLEHEVERLESQLKTERLKNKELLAERKKLSLSLASNAPAEVVAALPELIPEPTNSLHADRLESFESRMALRKCLKCSSYKERIEDLTKDISNKRDKITRLTTQLETAVAASKMATRSLDSKKSSAKEIIEQYLSQTNQTPPPNPHTSFEDVAPPSPPEGRSSSRTFRASAKQIVVYQQIELEDITPQPIVVDQATQTDEIPTKAVGIERQRSSVPTQDILAKNHTTLVDEDFQDMATRIYSYVTTIDEFEKIFEENEKKEGKEMNRIESVLSTITQSKEELSPASSIDSVVGEAETAVTDSSNETNKQVSQPQQKKKESLVKGVVDNEQPQANVERTTTQEVESAKQQNRHSILDEVIQTTSKNETESSNGPEENVNEQPVTSDNSSVEPTHGGEQTNISDENQKRGSEALTPPLFYDNEQEYNDDDLADENFVGENYVYEENVEDDYPVRQQHSPDPKTTPKKKVSGAGQPSSKVAQPELNSPRKQSKNKQQEQQERNQVASQKRPREPSTVNSPTTNNQQNVSNNEDQKTKRSSLNNKTQLPAIGVKPPTPNAQLTSTKEPTLDESDDKVSELPAIQNRVDQTPTPLKQVSPNLTMKNPLKANEKPRGKNSQPKQEFPLLTGQNIEHTQQVIRNTLEMVPDTGAPDMTSVTSDSSDIKRRGNESGFFEPDATKTKKTSKWQKVRNGVINHIIRFINTTAKCKCSHLYKEISKFDPTDKSDNEIIKGELSIFAQHAIDILDVIAYTVKQMGESTKSPTASFPGEESNLLSKFGQSWNPKPHRRVGQLKETKKSNHSQTSIDTMKNNRLSVILPEIATQGNVTKTVKKPNTVKRQGEIIEMKAKVAEKKRLKLLDRHKKLVNKLKQSGVGIKEIYTILGITNNEETSPPVGIEVTSTTKRKISLTGHGYRDNPNQATSFSLNAHGLGHQTHEKSNRLMAGLDGARGYSRRLSVVDPKTLQSSLANTKFPFIKQPSAKQPQLAVKPAMKPVLFGPNIMKGRSAANKRGIR